MAALPLFLLVAPVVIAIITLFGSKSSRDEDVDGIRRTPPLRP